MPRSVHYTLLKLGESKDICLGKGEKKRENCVPVVMIMFVVYFFLIKGFHAGKYFNQNMGKHLVFQL